jgi:hypothetical protein
MKKLKIGDEDIKTTIPVICFTEGKKVVAYSPALDLSSCGDDEEQARKRFAEAAEIFLDEIVEMGTVDEVLSECGWTKSPDEQSWVPPVFKSCSNESVLIPAGA